MNSSPQSVFLIGTAYSGSSVLGTLLQQHFIDTAYVGELSRTPTFRKKYHLDLADGECQACLISEKDCELFSPDELKKFGSKIPSEAHRYLAKVCNANTIIDGSKHPAWLREFMREHNLINVRVILTVRNPKYYVQSCLDREIGEPWQAANAWRDTYVDAVRTINTLGIAHLVVRNEDLLQNESEILSQVDNFLGLEQKSANMSEIVHSLGGNPAVQLSMLGSKKVKTSVNRLGRSVLDLNPIHKNSLTKQKITFDTQVLFNTPSLSDTANLLGYCAKDLI